jgi:type I restriction enzyme R subunit
VSAVVSFESSARIAVDLFAILERKKQEIDDWRAKEQTRDEMRQAIHDFLYSDATSLPESYGESEIDAKASAVFEHVYRMNA